MSGYTRGPWLYRGKSDSVHTSCETHPYGPYIFSFKEESSPTDEDLALILAAPELLEALKEMVEAGEFSDWDNRCAAQENARQVIAKAEGCEDVD